MKRPVMVRRRKGSDQEDHQGQIGKEGRERPTRSLWKWKFYVFFFLKVQQQLKSAKNNLKNQTFFMRKGTDQEDHQGQIGKERGGKANKIPVEVEVLCNCFFSKGPTSIEIS